MNGLPTCAVNGAVNGAVGGSAGGGRGGGGGGASGGDAGGGGAQLIFSSLILHVLPLTKQACHRPPPRTLALPAQLSGVRSTQ